MEPHREEEELQVGGEAVSEASIAKHSTNLFTPLNPRQASHQYITPNGALHYPAFQSDISIYDIPAEDDDRPEQPIKKGRKRPTSEKQGHSYAIGSVWQYTDEDELECQRDSVHEHYTPKRLKSMPEKMNRGKKAPFKMQVLDANDACSLGHDDEERLSSQLTPPHDSGRSGSKKTTTSRKRKEPLPAFKNLTITKPIQIQPKEKVADTAPCVTSYQGWSTTQDAVKSSYNGIAKTTLDKLAAFRYKFSSDSQHVDALGISQSQPSFQPAHEKQDTEIVHVATKYEYAPIGERAFQYAAWNPELTHPSFEEAPHAIDPFNPRAEITSHGERCVVTPLHSSACQEQEQGETVVGNITSPNVPQVPAAVLSRLLFSSPKSAFSEARVKGSQLRVVEMDRENSETLQGEGLESSPAILHGFQGVTSRKFDYPPIRSPINEIERPIGADDENATQRTGSIETATSDPKKWLVYDAGLVSDLEDEFDDDGFDDGIADSDLLAITGNVAPLLDLRSETGLNVRPIQVGPQNNVLTPVFVDDSHASLDSVPPQPPRIAFGSDQDMFPMATSDEKRKLYSHEQQNQVIERFQAPASLQKSISDTRSRDREVFDCSLQFSPPNSNASIVSPRNSPGYHPTASNSDPHSNVSRSDSVESEEEDWSFVETHSHSTLALHQPPQRPSAPAAAPQHKTTDLTMCSKRDTSQSSILDLDDSHEYKPLERFLRPEFPDLVRDRCPIVGVSAQTFLRVCFRISEMFREGTRCQASGQDAVIELFARVTFSSRESGTFKQQFQFSDLWSDKPPYPIGILANYKISALQDRESGSFLDNSTGKMARCLGRLKQDRKSNTGWLLNIISIRETDWEEVRWTKRILTAGIQGAEGSATSNL